ncbi:MAG TPA: hypothetical protein VFP10_04605, partial [Candidatus Eisenbacteria bacterium]|nr:hypothetical protein [Candidatus Eisenbacteria bacterium]
AAVGAVAEVRLHRRVAVRVADHRDRAWQIRQTDLAGRLDQTAPADEVVLRPTVEDAAVRAVLPTEHRELVELGDPEARRQALARRANAFLTSDTSCSHSATASPRSSRSSPCDW